MKLSESRAATLHGILLIALFACASFQIAQVPLLTRLSISPMIIGIVLGMIYANSLRNHLPAVWVPGIIFCSKRLLRLGIILYGFRLTLADLTQVGLAAIIVDVIIVTFTILLGVMIGRMLKMDSDTALLTSVGSAICGAAAVLGAEAAIHAKPYKTAVAVATVVIFGTVAMFIYPVAYRAGILDLTPIQMGIFGGSTLHEVAHAVGAGNAMGPEVGDTCVIVKMIRVMLLVPVLLVLALWIAPRRAKSPDAEASGSAKVNIPWFAIGFLVVIAFNSLSLLTVGVVDAINTFDTFLLTMAMAALGAETSFAKFKLAGPRPFILALILFIWLMVGGYLLARYLVPVFPF